MPGYYRRNLLPGLTCVETAATEFSAASYILEISPYQGTLSASELSTLLLQSTPEGWRVTFYPQGAFDSHRTIPASSLHSLPDLDFETVYYWDSRTHVLRLAFGGQEYPFNYTSGNHSWAYFAHIEGREGWSLVSREVANEQDLEGIFVITDGVRS